MGLVIIALYSLNNTYNCAHINGPIFPWIWISRSRTSDSGNGNHSVSLPITLLKNKVDQMLPSSYISSLLVSIL